MDKNVNPVGNYPFVPIYNEDKNFCDLSKNSQEVLKSNINNILEDIFIKKRLRCIDEENILFFDYIISEKLCKIHTEIFKPIATYHGFMTLNYKDDSNFTCLYSDISILKKSIDNIFRELGNLSLLYTSNNISDKIKILTIVTKELYKGNFFTFGNYDVLMIVLSYISVQINYPLKEIYNSYRFNQNILVSLMQEINENSITLNISKQLERFFISLAKSTKS